MEDRELTAFWVKYIWADHRTTEANYAKIYTFRLLDSRRIGVGVSKRLKFLNVNVTCICIQMVCITTPTAWVNSCALQATRINHKMRSYKVTHGPHKVCHASTLYSILNLTNHNVRHSIKTPYVIKDPLSKE